MWRTMWCSEGATANWYLPVGTITAGEAQQCSAGYRLAAILGRLGMDSLRGTQ